MGHQLIYTVAKRGLKGGNGHCVYSYDEFFPQGKLRGTTYFSQFKWPKTIDVSQIVDSSETDISVPNTFSYFYDGKPHFYSKTYLGKEYLEARQRPGNFLSHLVILDEVTDYPISFYGSSDFRETMSKEEVNSVQVPPFLPSISYLSSGYLTIERIRAFLSEGNRKVYITQLLGLLLGEKAKEKGRIICIADQFEYIPLWIAAVTYLLPQTLAKTITFSTYEYKPNSEVLNGQQFDLVGVVSEGTDYRKERAVYSINCDLASGTFGQEVISMPRYINWAVEQFLASSNNIERLNHFIQQYLQSADLLSAIDKVLDCYRYFDGQHDMDFFDSAVAVVSSYGKSETKVAFFEKVLSSPMLNRVLDSPYRKNVLHYLKQKHQTDALAYTTAVVSLINIAENLAVKTELYNALTQAFLSYSKQDKIVILNSCDEEQVLGQYIETGLSKQFDEFVSLIADLSPVKQLATLPSLLTANRQIFEVITLGITTHWTPKLISELLIHRVDYLFKTLTGEQIDLFFQWSRPYGVPVELQLLKLEKDVLTASSIEEKLACLSVIDRTVAQSKRESLKSFIDSMVTLVLVDIETAQQLSYLYHCFDQLKVVDMVDTSLWQQISQKLYQKGQSEFLLEVLQFNLEQGRCFDALLQDIIQDKQLKRQFDYLDKVIRKGKLDVTSQLYNYFLSCKQENSDANRFRLFSKRRG